MPPRLNIFYRNAAEEFARRAIAALGDDIHSIVLYGSVARKQAKRESDIDLLVVGHNRELKRRVRDIAYEVSEVSEFEAFVTVVYYSREEFYRLMEMGSTFLANVLREGVVLYDNGTVRSQGRQVSASR